MANTGIVGSNPANQANGQDVHTRSKFPFGYKFADTHRFGEYHPFFVMEGVEGDKIDLHCSHEVRSYTLKAPLLQDIQLKKDYFVVPREAILPMNWDKFYTIPTIGDDVRDDVGTSVLGFWELVCNGWNSMKANLLGNSNPTGVDFLTGMLRTLFVGEMFFSEGNLMSSLGIHGGSHFTCQRKDNSGQIYEDWTYDQFFDFAIGQIKSGFHSFVIEIPFREDNGSGASSGVKSYRVLLSNLENFSSVGSYIPRQNMYDVPLRVGLQIMRDNPFRVTQVYSTANATTTVSSQFIQSIKDSWNLSGGQNSQDFGNVVAVNYLVDEDVVDLARLWAYQIVVNHFYSNDHVDYIYSAQLFRELIGYYVSQFLNNSSGKLVDTFSYNGVDYQYDFLSAHYFALLIDVLNDSLFLTDYQPSDDSTFCYSYFSQLFGFKRSLRFLDYFSGSRSRPLAVAQSDINVNVDGTSGTGYSVSAINITKGIQAQRLANAVNRFGRKFEDYIAGMSGKRPAPDYHNPFYLSHTSDVIYGQESEYTGSSADSDPQNVTSVLRSAGGKYAFQIECDRPSILIGLAYYDIERFYGCTIERQVLHLNRYDMFNKYMQFIGDQPIYKSELGIRTAGNLTDGNFAYTNRHMEYKQRYNQTAGGFNVPSTDIDLWLFRADKKNIMQLSNHINPNFIRSWNVELDQYYQSLTGYSLGTYFHFIVKNINSCEANRPMAYAPSIL